MYLYDLCILPGSTYQYIWWFIAIGNVYLRSDLTGKSAGNRSMSAGVIMYDWLFSLSDLFVDFTQLEIVALRERQSTMMLRKTHWQKKPQTDV